MLQIILAILLVIPTICNAQATRMSNGAAATSGAAILTGIVEEPPPASNEEDLGANGVFACSWEDGSDELNTGASASYVWGSEAGTDSGLDLLGKGTTANYGFSGDQSEYLILSGTISATDYLIRDITDTANLGVRFAFYVDSGFSADDATGVIILQTRVSNGASNGGVQAKITRAAGAQTLTLSSYTGVWTDMGTATLTEDTWYQLRLRWDNSASAGASWSLHTEAGGEVASGTLSGTTSAASVDQIRFGSVSGTPSKALTVRFDAFMATNTYAFPDLKAW